MTKTPRLSVARILILSGALIVIAAGGGVYYTNHYGYYRTSSLETLALQRADGKIDRLPVLEVKAIESPSSPLRFRACLRLSLPLKALLQTYVAIDNPEPRIGPNSFPCFDAKAIGAALEEGRAHAFMSHPNITPGIDRVVAAFGDGRAYVWHRLNKTY